MHAGRCVRERRTNCSIHRRAFVEVGPPSSAAVAPAREGRVGAQGSASGSTARRASVVEQAKWLHRSHPTSACLRVPCSAFSADRTAAQLRHCADPRLSVYKHLFLFFFFVCVVFRVDVPSCTSGQRRTFTAGAAAPAVGGRGEGEGEGGAWGCGRRRPKKECRLRHLSVPSPPPTHIRTLPFPFEFHDRVWRMMMGHDTCAQVLDRK